MTVPKDIQEKIAEKYKITERVGYGFIQSNHKKIGLLRRTAEFGYSLAAQQLEEKDKEVRYAEKVAYETSKKNADMIAEIERLKGLIEKEFKENNGWDMEKKEDGNYEMFQSRELKESEWKQFKLENNL